MGPELSHQETARLGPLKGVEWIRSKQLRHQASCVTVTLGKSLSFSSHGAYSSVK